MKGRHGPMPILRLAYTTQFLIALIAIFVLWSQVGGQSHLDLLPWWVKLGLGVAAAYTIVRATVASGCGDRGWNGQGDPTINPNGSQQNGAAAKLMNTRMVAQKLAMAPATTRVFISF